jgi:hypothetical protein
MAPEITFTAFQIEGGWDYVRLYAGADSSAPQVAELSGGTNPGVLASPTAAATLVYDSDGSVNQAGFTATVACIAFVATPPPPPDPCTTAGGADVAPGDVFTSPNYPSNYANNRNCQWNMVCPAGQVPTVTFTAFNLESGWDYVRLDTTGDGSTDTDLDGTAIPSPAVAYSAVLDTDGSVTQAGFEATFSCA